MKVLALPKFPIQMTLTWLTFQLSQITNYSSRLHTSFIQTSQLCLFPHSLQLLLRFLLHNYCLFKISHLLEEFPRELPRSAFKT